MDSAPFHYQHPTLKSFDPVDVLQLIRSENVGPVTFFHLISFYGSPKEALRQIPDLAKRGGSRRPLKPCNRSDAEKEYEAIARFGAQIILYGQPDYPVLLTGIHDAPPLLIVKGHPVITHNRSVIGIVGARNGSANGCAFAKHIATQLGQQQFLVASGLARGIDTAAHLGSIASGTIAVIAGGIDHIYPPENAALYQQITESGLIITEAPFGTAPMARHFPARNRIISGMSHGVIVVEASLKSGSLITANYALDYGREVFSVPGSPMDPRCKGSNELIRNGAVLTESIEDITRNLPDILLPPLAESGHGAFQSAPTASFSEEIRDTARARLLEKLGPEPVFLDELLAQCDITPHIMQCILLELELAGRLLRHVGGRVSLRYEV